MFFIEAYIATSQTTQLTHDVHSQQDLLNFDMLLPSLDSAPLMLNALLVENLFTTDAAATQLLTDHYYKQSLQQAYKILGSLDVIGNPVKLWSNISTGTCSRLYGDV